MHIGQDEGLAELALHDEFSADFSSFRMHPALLDLATGCALYLTDGYEDSNDLYLPFAYKRVRFHSPIPPRFFSHIRPRQENLLHGEVESFDITLFDEQDQVLAEIEGFAMRRAGDPSKVVEANPRALVDNFAGGEQPIEITNLLGIPSSAGARALTKILGVRTPSGVVAVSQALKDLATRAYPGFQEATGTAAPAAAQPGEGVEGTLAAWWQDLLGVEQVALDDDFFALGGHSLVGVRLFAKIKKTYQVDLELAVLF